MLNREIKEAYNGLLEPSTSRSSRSSHPSSDSPSISRRRATTEFGERPVKRPKVTYGARKSQDDSIARFDIEDAEPIQKNKRIRLIKDFNFKGDSADEVAETVDHYNTSSGWLADFGKSEKLNGATSTEGRRGKSDDEPTVSNQSMAPPASRSSGASQQPLQSSSGSTWPNTERASSPPAAGVLTPVTQRTRKRALSELETSTKIMLGDEIPPSSSAPATSPVKRARMDMGGQDRALSSPPRKSDDGHDELPLSTTSSPRSTRKQSKVAKAEISNTEQEDRDFALALKLQEEEDKDVTTQKRRRGDTNKATQLAADDLMPDLPADQYQPRPSRSRSARTMDDLIIPSDFSKRPETLAKKKEKGKGKGKRGKTKADDEPQQGEIQQQEDQLDPYPKSQELEPNAKDAQRPQSEDPTFNEPDPATLDDPQEPTLLPAPDPPQPPQKEPKKPRGRPKKDVLPPPPLPPPEFPQRKELAVNTANNPAPAKRGRKKKQKVISEEIITDEEPEDPKPETDEVDAGRGGGGGGVLKEIAINTIHTPILPTRSQEEKEEEENEEGIDTPPLPERDKLEKVEVMNNIKREGVKTSPAPGATSETGGGLKSIYRVGLSKRQRIAPLLKIVKK